jgi:ribulose-bisphosphate carboxylase large chain
LTDFYAEPAAGEKFETAVEAVAGESSIGTWTEVGTMKERIKKLAPTIYRLDRKAKTAKIAYPAELFETGNIPQILSSIAGNVFGMKIVENLRLNDVVLPKKLVKSFLGPAFGVEGIRKTLKIHGRPLCGTIVKPKIGLSPKEHAQVAYEAWVGGLDLVKDDENLSSQSFNNFRDRVTEVLAAKEKAEDETGEGKLAVLNTTHETMEMLDRAKYIKKSGGNCAMIDIITCGWAGLQSLRQAKTGLILHGHRAMHAAITRNLRHGVSMRTIALFARLAGIDELHVGTFSVGKMVEAGGNEDSMVQKKIMEPLYGVKPVFTICSGGLHPGLVERLVQRAGKNIIMQAGGGVHGHPGGTREGARAMRQAIDAVTRNVTLKEYAKSHPQLAQAIQKWGTA